MWPAFQKFFYFWRDTAKPGLWTLDWTVDWTMDWTGDDQYQFSEALRIEVWRLDDSQITRCTLPSMIRVQIKNFVLVLPSNCNGHTVDHVKILGLTYHYCWILLMHLSMYCPTYHPTGKRWGFDCIWPINMPWIKGIWSIFTDDRGKYTVL